MGKVQGPDLRRSRIRDFRGSQVTELKLGLAKSQSCVEGMPRIKARIRVRWESQPKPETKLSDPVGFYKESRNRAKQDQRLDNQDRERI